MDDTLLWKSFQRWTHLFNSLTCVVFTLRRQQEVGQSLPSFHSFSNLPPLGPTSAQHAPQRPQAGPEAAAGGSHGRPRHRGSSAHSGCNYPPSDRSGLSTGRGACLSHNPPATAHTNWLSHVRLQDGQCCAHCWRQSRSSDRWVLRVRVQHDLSRGYYVSVSLLCSGCLCRSCAASRGSSAGWVHHWTSEWADGESRRGQHSGRESASWCRRIPNTPRLQGLCLDDLPWKHSENEWDTTNENALFTLRIIIHFVS